MAINDATCIANLCMKYRGDWNARDRNDPSLSGQTYTQDPTNKNRTTIHDSGATYPTFTQDHSVMRSIIDGSALKSNRRRGYRMCRVFSGRLILALSVVLSLILGVILPVVATTGEIGQVGHFTVSPDGRKIVFVSVLSQQDRGGWASVMLLDLMTGNIVPLTGKVGEAVSSPDGKYIGYTESDNYYGNSLSLLTTDGRKPRIQYQEGPFQRFSQLKWSVDSKYLTFISDDISPGMGHGKRNIVISPQIGVIPDELAITEWQAVEQLPQDHPIYQEKPTVNTDGIVLWGDNKTIYAQAVDGIWKGSLDEGSVVRWNQLLADENLEGTFIISASGTHLLYRQVYHRRNARADVRFSVLPLADGAAPVKIGTGMRAQFTHEGQHILMTGWPVHGPYEISGGLGLWMISLDGSSKRKLTRQKGLP